ncbi:MAG TPA: YdeI/OmpD-associated family protein, partial [Saprospiraceae bacterium]|nr:YdeI/OmpD-associated family protein [Saprospiraceae bacterium]
DHDPLPVPEDLGLCLKDEPQTAQKFDLLSTAQKDSAIRHINNAKSQNTRESRIANLLHQLSLH